MSKKKAAEDEVMEVVAAEVELPPISILSKLERKVIACEKKDIVLEVEFSRIPTDSLMYME